MQLERSDMQKWNDNLQFDVWNTHNHRKTRDIGLFACHLGDDGGFCCQEVNLQKQPWPQFHFQKPKE